MAPHPGNYLAEIDAYAYELTQNDSRAMIMQKTTLWLAQLYGRWTTLSDDEFASQNAPLNEDDVADLAAATTDDSVYSQASEGGVGNSPGHSMSVKSSKPAIKTQPRRVRILETEPEQQPKLRGILKKRTVPFYEEFNPFREGVAALHQAGKDGVPPGARWTKISRVLVNPEALERAKERFEERDDFVIVLRVLNKQEIAKLAERTREIRGKHCHILNFKAKVSHQR